MINTRILVLIGLCWCCNLSISTAQCDSSAYEIPHNGIDEDCDNLDDLFLHLPPYIYLLDGQEYKLYFRNTIVSIHPDDYTFSVKSELTGTMSTDRWAYTPDSTIRGEYPIRISVMDANGDTLASASSVFRVCPDTLAQDTVPQSLFLLGHSFIDQGYLPFYLKKLTERPGGPVVRFHGSRNSWIGNTPHEGIGGASWEYYIHNPNSPIFFDSVFNLRRYLDTYLCPGCSPHWFIIHLDVNDFCFPGALSANSLPEVDSFIDNIYRQYAGPLVDSLRSVTPNTRIAICTTPPPNGRDSAFVFSFGASSSLANRYRWEKIVSRVRLKYEEYFAGREAENIWLLPIHLDVDHIAEFNPFDPVHPHPDPSTTDCPSGYKEIAKEMYAWMCYKGCTLADSMVSSINIPHALGVQVFPNPASGEINIQAEGLALGKLQVQLFNVLGKTLVNQQVVRNVGGGFSTKLDVSSHPAGAYFLSIQDGKGNRAVRKVLVE